MKQDRHLFRCVFVFVLSLLTFAMSPVFSAYGAELQRVEIPSSFNPVGSGARALGMGGAFIAVADDATAASWNPAGLIQLEKPEISMVGNFFHRIEENDFGTNPEADGSESVDKSDLNYLSASYPFTLWGRNMIVSLNYQYLFDMTRQWNFFLDQPSETVSTAQHIDYRQDGDLSAIGLACAVQVTPRVSFGVTLNIWDDDMSPNEWEQKTTQWGFLREGETEGKFIVRDYNRYSFSGVNANIGFLWNATDKLTVGAVLKTPFEADLNHVRHSYAVSEFGQNDADHTEKEATLDMPMSYGIGLAYRFSDHFTLSFDVYRTEWDDFEFEEDGVKRSPISGKKAENADIDPTHQVRLGAEYLFITDRFVVPVRGGLFYDPAPAEGGTDDYYGITLGSGIGYGRYVFDVAYQFRFGDDVGSSVLEGLDFSQDIREHTVYASVIVYF